MKLVPIKLDFTSTCPISEQIANKIQRMILDGDIESGTRLPSERDLAEDLGVSRGTIKRSYTKLANMNAIEIRRGSGGYVLNNANSLELNKKKAASDVIASTFERLTEMGLSEKEIVNLVNLRYFGSTLNKGLRKISIMVVSNNHDILSELEQQLSYLSSTSAFLFTISFITINTIASSPDPVQMLLTYDFIIATSIDYPEIMRLAPMFKGKILEVSISPRTKTLMEISELHENSHINVIHRTDIFKRLIERTLLSLNFKKQNIFYFLDNEYDPTHHWDNSVSAVINHNESPVFVDPKFEKRNSDFIDRGGKIIRFSYQIERNSLIFIEDQIQKILRQEIE